MIIRKDTRTIWCGGDNEDLVLENQNALIVENKDILGEIATSEMRIPKSMLLTAEGLWSQ